MTRRLRSSTLLALGLAALVAAPAAHAAPKLRPEGYPAFRKQLARGQVRGATIYTRARTIHVSLGLKREYTVRYPAADRAALITKLRSSHVLFHVKTIAVHKKKSGGIRKRWIAVGAVVLVGLIAGVLMLARRRRRS